MAGNLVVQKIHTQKNINLTTTGDIEMSVYDLKRTIVPSFNEDYFFGVVVSPKSQIVSLCGSQNKIKLYKLPYLNFIGELSGHKKGVKDLKFNQNGNNLVSCSEDGSLRLWDLKSMKPITSQNNLNIGEVFGVDINLQQEHMVACCGEFGDVAVCDSRKNLLPVLKYQRIHSDIARQVMFCNSERFPANAFTDEDGQNLSNRPLLLSGSDDGCINIYDLTISNADEGLIHVIPVDCGVDKFGLASYDNTSLNLLYVLGHNQEMALWDIITPKRIGNPVSRDSIGAKYFIDSKYIPSHRCIYNFAGNDKGQILLSKFVVENGKSQLQPIAQLNGGHTSFVRGIWTSENFDDILTVGEDSRMSLWGLSSKNPSPNATSTTSLSPQSIPLSTSLTPPSSTSSEGKKLRTQGGNLRLSPY